MGISLKKIYQGSPAVIAPPMFVYPATASTGGTLAAGATRYCVVTAVVNGAETLPSAETSFVVPAGTNTNTITWGCTLVPGATAYKFYASNSTGTEQLIGTSATPTLVDTGTAGSGNPPSSTTLVEATASPGLYTPPAGVQTVVRRLIVSNPTTVSGVVSLSAVSSGGTGGAANRIIAAMPVPPDGNAGPINEPMFIALQPGDFLTGAVTVAGMVLTLMGAEIQ